jgi:PAS domain S-box-containing protein
LIFPIAEDVSAIALELCKFGNRPVYFGFADMPDNESTAPCSDASASLAANSAQNNIESSLLEANRRLKSILIANEVATWIWDIPNNRVVADENLARMFGVSAGDALGGPIEKYLVAIHAEDRSDVQSAISKALEGPNNRYETSYRLVRADGVSWVTARGTVEHDAAGRARYLSGVVIDISALKTVERRADELLFRLERQSRILDITLSSISDFAYIFDRDGRFVFVNQGLLNLWGLKLEEAVGRNFFELKYPDELAARLQRQIQEVFETKTGLTDETEYTSQTGAGGYYEYIFCPVLDREGNVELVAGSTRDITERKRVEAELRHSQEQFRNLAESLESQVKARTNDVVSQSERLSELSVRLMTTQDEERRRIAREMHDSAGQTIAALSMNVSQISRLVGGGNPRLLELANDAENMLKQLGEEIRTTSYLLHPPMLDEFGLRVALSWYVEGLHQRSGIEVQLLVGDFERLPREIELTIFRVIQECLTNIHRHSGSKSARIQLLMDGANVVIEVQDFGHGIPEEKLDTIRNRAAGVGLRGMRERVRPFAGDVRIDSQEGMGTTVTVTIPYAAGA